MLLFPVYGDTSSDYTHSEYMARFKTKNDVLSTFGPPNSKEVSDGFEYWSYNKGTVQNSYARATGNAYNTNYGVGANANAYGSTSSYEKSIRFTIQGNRVTRWSTAGMDYSNDDQFTVLFCAGLLVDFLATVLVLAGLGEI